MNMKRKATPRFLAAIIAALCISLLAISAFAQTQTGNIFGKVQGKDGSVLPGVTVTLSGVGAAQTAITDAQGNFRFINLSPGSYNLKAELAGLGSSTRNGIDVNLGRNADVTLTLNPAVAESITVTAGAPLLDVRKTGTGSDVSKVELQSIPTARDPWVILQQTPGVTMDRNNVGGNESGQQSVYVSKGTTGTQSTWNVDGVNITDFAATGSSPAYYDFDSFEEMQITTGGTDPRIQTAGVQLNMVTKRGTNDFKGSGRAFHTSNDYQADPKIPSEATGYLKRINQINKIDDDGGEIGGPIVKDRLWFWGAYGEQKIDILTASLLTSGARFQDKTTLKNENLKLNAQPITSNSLTAVDQYGSKIKLGRNVSTARFPETGWNQNDAYAKGTGSLTDPTLWKIEDTQLIGQNLYLTGLYSKVQGGFQLIADNGKGCQTFACANDSLASYIDATPGGDSAFHRSYLSVVGLRPQKQTRLDGSAFVNTGTLSHELKFGFGYRNSSVTSHTAWPSDQIAIITGPGVGNGDNAEAEFTRFPDLTFTSKSQDAYIGDTMLFGNLTVQAALRYDQQKGTSSAGTARANVIVPAILPAETFAGVSGQKWNNLSPRLGLTYAVGADRRTLLRAQYSRYVDQLQSNVVTPVSPGAYSYVYYYFNDLNHNNSAELNEVDFAAGNQGFAGFDPSHPTNATAFTRWAKKLSAPHTDEIILGGERELMTDFSVGINGTYRKLSNFVGTVGEHTQGANDFYTSADYVLHAPITAQLPNGQKVQLSYYTLKPGVAVPLFKVIRNTPDYYQQYKGLEFTGTKRMSNRWMLRGNLTLQDWTQHVGSGAIVDPTRGKTCGNCNGSEVIFQSTGSGAKGSVFINSKWSASLTGAYQIPVIETSFGFNVNSRQGYALPYSWGVSGGSEGTKHLLVPTDVDSFRNPTVTEVDMRLAKEIKLSHVGLTLSIDGFNMLNSNTILQRVVSGTGSAQDLNRSGGASGQCKTLADGSIDCSAALNASANHISEVLSPRVFRLGARLSF
jgi:hypothetical protein